MSDVMETPLIDGEIRESDAPVWSVIETLNGNRYIVLPSRRQAFIGNREWGRTDPDAPGWLDERSNGTCIVVGRVEMK